MSKCWIERIFGCKEQVMSEYVTHLVKAVNKLHEAIGVPGTALDYRQGVDSAQETMQAAIHTIKKTAKRLDATRLEYVSNADALRDAESEMTALKQTIARLEQEKRAWQQQSAHPPEAPQNAYQGLAISFIPFRDRLLYFRDEFQEAGDTHAVKLLNNLYKEMGRLMCANAVEVLEECGSFDAAQQTVVGTQPTDDPALDNIVVETVRPGYRICGMLYRPQEVVIYVYKAALTIE